MDIFKTLLENKNLRILDIVMASDRLTTLYNEDELRGIPSASKKQIIAFLKGVISDLEK